MVSRYVSVILLSLGALAASGSAATAQWTAGGIPVSDTTGTSAQANVCATTDGAGGAILAWEDSRSGSTDIYATRVVGNGWRAAGWPAANLPVCTAANLQQAPDIVTDGAGGAFVLWMDYRSPGSQNLYLQRVTGSGTVPAPWPANGMVVCTSATYPNNPTLLADGAGGVIVVWEDYRGGTDADVYAMRISAGGARLWTLQGQPVCVTTGDQTYPVCAPDGAGGALIAWQDSRAGASTDIYLQHLDPSGAIAAGAWLTNGISLTPTSGLRLAFTPAIVADSAGGALVAWEDLRNGNDYDIYAQRVTGSGAIVEGWTAGGTAVCSALRDQVGAVLVADGTNGMITVWADYRNDPSGLANDLYAQRTTGAGVRDAAWPVEGAAVCTAYRNQSSPRAVPDGASGFVVTWYDSRLSTINTDIYAQRITGAGQVASGWTADGVTLCTDPTDQQSPTLVSDNNGGALVAWHDHRWGDYDIYAQCVTGSGAVGPSVDVPTAAPVAFRLHEPRPNPATGPVRLAFELPVARVVEARVFDLAGRTVRTLEAGRSFPAGAHALAWDGCDEGGTPVAAGVYLVRLGAGTDQQVRRVVRLR